MEPALSIIIETKSVLENASVCGSQQKAHKLSGGPSHPPPSESPDYAVSHLINSMLRNSRVLTPLDEKDRQSREPGSLASRESSKKELTVTLESRSHKEDLEMPRRKIRMNSAEHDASNLLDLRACHPRPVTQT